MTPSERSTRSLLRRLTMASTHAPRWRTRSTVRLVSVVVPDWLTATISVSDMSSASSKPDSSVASDVETIGPLPARQRATDSATLRAATAAVPWPMAMMRRMAPDVSRSATDAGRACAPSSTPHRPLRSTTRPRNVLRNDCGASVISFSRKWANPPRSMSRVVIVAWTSSPSATGSGVPS